MTTMQIDDKKYNVARIASIMNNITRYSTTPSLIKESVSDHSFLIGLLIIDASTEYPELFKYVKRENLLIRAVLHDMVETITGDIPSPAKRAVPECETVFDKIESAVSDELCKGRTDEFKDMLQSAISFSNPEDIEELLFKVFDYFCVLIKASNEIYIGNKYYKRVVREMNVIMEDLSKVISDRASRNKGFYELAVFYHTEVMTFLAELNRRVEKM